MEGNAVMTNHNQDHSPDADSDPPPVKPRRRWLRFVEKLFEILALLIHFYIIVEAALRLLVPAAA